MSIKVSGGGGGGLPPGVTGDGSHGLIVAESFSAGNRNANAGQYPDTQYLIGSTIITDADSNCSDHDETVIAEQGYGLTNNHTKAVARISRHGSLNGFQYTAPAHLVEDTSGSTAPLARWDNNSGQAVILGQAGGLALFGKVSPPTAPRTLPQATIDAITDASAKAAAQAFANILSDMGALTIT